MKLELHMIQNFAPACLNRDDTNSPKDCEFGGVRRARISSQCLKRAMRTCFRESALLPPENQAVRTKRVVDEVASALAKKGKDEAAARDVVAAALGGVGLHVGEDGQTQYLLFLSRTGIDALGGICLKHWDALAALAGKPPAAEEGKPKRSAKDAKRAAKEAVSEEVQKAAAVLLEGRRAADLALFGRMLADLPGRNIDAACQVAHAISTHKVSMETDFFTAVDDLKTDAEDAGAGMMGVIDYNSACFYRYALLDWAGLLKNLGEDEDLARKTVEAFLTASALALPTGKQNTFAAHSRPDLIVAVVRAKGAPLSLANAFVAPARPVGEKDLTQVSADKLADNWKRATSVYGDGEGLIGPFYCGTTVPAEPPPGWQDVKTLGALTKMVLHALGKEK
jgi:CRISPR system Cascade subunit CasC